MVGRARGVGRCPLPECRGSWGDPWMDPRGGFDVEKGGPIPSKYDPDGSGAWFARRRMAGRVDWKGARAFGIPRDYARIGDGLDLHDEGRRPDGGR